MSLPPCLTLAALLLGTAFLHAQSGSSPPPGPAATTVLKTPALVAFWDFTEDAGNNRISRIDPAQALEEMGGPVERVAAGPFGTAIKLKAGQWLRLPRARLGPLDIHGPQAQVTVMAWVKRERKQAWQAIAGVWDESRRKRQYCLFLNAASKTDFRTMKRTPCQDLFQGHVSSVGGPTPGEAFCLTYASSGTAVPMTEWQCLALTYDAKEVRLYLNGRLDAAEGCNPFPYAEGLFDGGSDGAEFTVGAVSVRDKPGNFFGGLIGGLAVFQRALTAEEISTLHQATRPTKGSE